MLAWAWLVAFGKLVSAFATGTASGLFPIVAYNRIQGSFGWSLFLGVLFSILLVAAKEPKKTVKI
ncbi:hypothetical protein ACVR0A_09045 [Streptococcus downei]|uniref:hypothetical protein n=1 Tax=Streptococcus downei TaxID=1317 RepID=UPI0001E99F77|nr:hypothetical protein [Streptococcus downei]EFQ58256.1 hypothetical protein HMPREF9176_0698 [Streptococcus downei F0415]